MRLILTGVRCRIYRVIELVLRSEIVVTSSVCIGGSGGQNDFVFRHDGLDDCVSGEGHSLRSSSSSLSLSPTPSLSLSPFMFVLLAVCGYHLFGKAVSALDGEKGIGEH